MRGCRTVFAVLWTHMSHAVVADGHPRPVTRPYILYRLFFFTFNSAVGSSLLSLRKTCGHISMTQRRVRRCRRGRDESRRHQHRRRGEGLHASAPAQRNRRTTERGHIRQDEGHTHRQQGEGNYNRHGEGRLYMHPIPHARSHPQTEGVHPALPRRVAGHGGIPVFLQDKGNAYEGHGQGHTEESEAAGNRSP